MILGSVQSISLVTQSCLTFCNPMDCNRPGFSVHHQLLDLAQTHVIELVMPSNHLILCHPLLLLSSIFPSIRVFSNESAPYIRWPKYWSFSISSVQFSSVAQSCLTLCDSMNCSTPGLPVHHHLPEFTQTHVIELVMPSSHLILCHPLLLLPPIPPSIRVFSNESTLCMRWPKYWSFSITISPSQEHQGLISFRMD